MMNSGEEDPFLHHFPSCSFYRLWLNNVFFLFNFIHQPTKLYYCICEWLDSHFYCWLKNNPKVRWTQNWRPQTDQIVFFFYCYHYCCFFVFLNFWVFIFYFMYLSVHFDPTASSCIRKKRWKKQKQRLFQFKWGLFRNWKE